MKPDTLANILSLLFGLAATVTDAFIKNPAHHDKAEQVLTTVTAVAAPIAAALVASQATGQDVKIQ